MKKARWTADGGQREDEGGRRKDEKGWRRDDCSSSFILHPSSFILHPSSFILHPSSFRRGVLLLIVLALLAMFGVLAIAFVILTGQTRRGADALRKVGQYDDQWEKTANQAALDLFRGSNNHQSPLQAHNFLENLYGNEWFQGSMTGATAVIGAGQLIQFTFPAPPPAPPLFPNKTFLPEQHLGAVLTMLAGPATGYSTHIVGMVGMVGTTQLQIAAFEGLNSSDVIAYINNCGANGCPCLINGMPYSGAGFGFQWPPAKSTNAPSMLSYNNATTVAGNGDPGGWEFALLPNHAAFPYNTTDPGYSATYVNWLGQPDPAGPGGANPDYTAPDYQNMFLALRLTTPWTTPNGNVVYVPTPSFHRPELVNYWMNLNGGGTWSNPILQRKVLLRPLAAPINPGISAIDLRYGPWDVDNDGDGYADSIWIDPGYEIRSTPDGRLYKPLVAVLCIDLDGRLNLNAHGSLAQLQAGFNQTPNIGSLAYGGGASPPNGSLPNGLLGWGPADINLTPLFVNKPTEYQQFMTGNAPYDGRYVSTPASGSATDDLSANKEFDYPADYRNALGANDPAPGATVPRGYGTPPDLQGMLATGLDFRGQPIYSVIGGGVAALGTYPGCYSALCGNWAMTARAGNPYELDLSLRQPRGLRSPAPVFNPFSAAELEPLLRPYDRDTMTLPGRLLGLAPTSLGNASAGIGAKVTTDSWDLPCPNLAAPANWLAKAPGTLINSPTTSDGRIRHVTDLLKAAGVTTANMAAILPPDILSGLRMDINRPFGNGYVDDAYGLVADPAVVDKGPEFLPYVTPPTPPPSSPPSTGPRMDFANQGNSSNLVDPRQMCFRYLYVLGMVLTDPNSAPPNWFTSGAGNPPNVAAISAPSAAEARARWIAQWAANVVSFRDRDSIMKPFAYDPNFLANGGTWNPLQNIQHIVFSCERPELLITETLAFHEKRTEVFPDNETPTPKQLLMQRMRPQGSLYIELYNPWSATEAPPAEFYYDRTNTSKGWQQGVVLNQTTPQGHPVWRLIIPADKTVSKMPSNSYPADPDDPNVTLPIERSIYFANPSGLASTNPNDGTEFYPSSGGTGPNGSLVPILLHNHYALIGPPSSEQNTTGGNNGTWLSKASSGSPALILLDPTKYSPNQNPSAWPVQVLNNSTTTGKNDLPIAQIKQPLPIVIDQVTNVGVNPPPRLSISEPLGANAYPVPNGGTDGDSGDPQYFAAPPTPAPAPALPPPYAPLDTPSATNPITPETFNGTAVGNLNPDSTAALTACRVVHLQRLANPLMAYDGNPADIAYITGTGTPADGEIDWKKSTYNPYRTIDSMPIDLTVYNGWETTDNLLHATPNAQEPRMTTSFHSRQRGDYAFWGPGGANSTSTYFNNLWAQEWPQLSSSAYGWSGTCPAAQQLSNQMFPYQLQHTLAYINYGYYGTANGTPSSSQYTAPASQEYHGDPPAVPFPWLTWNNRPFCSPMELMLVPATSSSQLLYNYNVIGNPYSFSNGIPSNPSPSNPPAQESAAPVAATSPYTYANAPFGQLLNFFHCQAQSAPTAQLPTPAQFYRILEYLRVPSRFVGTELQVNPASQFSGDTGGGTHQFHPPYNRISRYRDPGRINLNTLNDPDVWNGLMQSAPGLFNNPQAFADFLYSRKGYPSINDSTEGNPGFVKTVTELNSASPTRFANPFRSFEGSHLVPLDVLYQGATCQPMTPGTAAQPGMDVNATLLRQDPSNTNRPLFGFDATVAQGNTPGSGRQYNNDQRNPYFRYQNLQRLGNLVTTRSNVFAVWITVGYFQVQKVPAGTVPNQQFIYPDGYQIIGELGADTGEVKRHRAFYIFDRSIPMGYQRGHDNNVSNGILLSRMIE
jgi:hypothetical protein